MEIYWGRVGEIANLISDNITKDGRIINKELLGNEILSKFEMNIKNKNISNMFIDDLPNEREIISWKNSIPELIEILLRAKLNNLHVIFEYNIPGANSRIDAVIIGENTDAKVNAVIVELKQWTNIIQDKNLNMCNVSFIYNGELYTRYHPCIQLKTYEKFLKNHHTEIEGGNIELNSCAYLHNFIDKDSLFSNQYDPYRKEYFYRVFTKSEESKNEFIDYLTKIFKNNSNEDYYEIFSNASYTIGENAYEKLNKFLNGEMAENMLGEQRVVLSDIYISVNKFIKEFWNDPKKRLVGIISGDVGVGKSILGLEILRFILNKYPNSKYGCYFTVINATLNEILSVYSEENNMILNTYSLIRNNPKLLGKVVIIDEAHRLADDTNGENTLRQNIEKIIAKNKMVFFLQDDKQRILLQEKGTVENIKKAIKEINDDKNFEVIYTKEEGHKLSTQRRASAASNYINALNDFLSDEIIVNKSFKPINYCVEIKDSLNEINKILKEKNTKNRCKWILPFCWEWNKTDTDVKVEEENFYMAWNPPREKGKKRQADWYLERDEKYLNEAGCIYTVQGLDFDFTGNIFFDDLYWENDKWNIDLNKIKDKFYLIDGIVKYYGGTITSSNNGYYVQYNNNFYELNKFLIYRNADMDEIITIIKNIYRVLLSRAKKGIYIWFKHEETKNRFKSIFK